MEKKKKLSQFIGVPFYYVSDAVNVALVVGRKIATTAADGVRFIIDTEFNMLRLVCV